MGKLERRVAGFFDSIRSKFRARREASEQAKDETIRQLQIIIKNLNLELVEAKGKTSEINAKFQLLCREIDDLKKAVADAKMFKPGAAEFEILKSIASALVYYEQFKNTGRTRDSAERLLLALSLAKSVDAKYNIMKRPGIASLLPTPTRRAPFVGDPRYAYNHPKFDDGTIGDQIKP